MFQDPPNLQGKSGQIPSSPFRTYLASGRSLARRPQPLNIGTKWTIKSRCPRGLRAAVVWRVVAPPGGTASTTCPAPLTHPGSSARPGCPFHVKAANGRRAALRFAGVGMPMGRRLVKRTLRIRWVTIVTQARGRYGSCGRRLSARLMSMVQRATRKTGNPAASRRSVVVHSIGGAGSLICVSISPCLARLLM